MNEEIDLELTTNKSNEIAKKLAIYFEQLMDDVPEQQREKIHQDTLKLLCLRSFVGNTLRFVSFRIGKEYEALVKIHADALIRFGNFENTDFDKPDLDNL